MSALLSRAFSTIYQVYLVSIAEPVRAVKTGARLYGRFPWHAQVVAQGNVGVPAKMHGVRSANASADARNRTNVVFMLASTHIEKALGLLRGLEVQVRA